MKPGADEAIGPKEAEGGRAKTIEGAAVAMRSSLRAEHLHRQLAAE
jgi:hypothetical protein